MMSLHGVSKNKQRAKRNQKRPAYRQIVTQPISQRVAVQKLTQELSRHSPNYERCIELLIRPIIAHDYASISPPTSLHTRKQLQIIAECAKRGACVPLKIFKKAAPWNDSEITNLWKYHILMSAIQSNQVHLCKKHPKIGELDGETKWNILEDAVQWHPDRWACLLHTNFFKRMPSDSSIYHNMQPQPSRCSSNCRVCNIIHALYCDTDALSRRTQHRYAYTLYRMMERADIQVHQLCLFISRSLVAFRGNTPEDAIAREQCEVAMEQSRRNEQAVLGGVDSAIVDGLRAYAHGADLEKIAKTYTQLQDVVPEVNRPCVNPGVCLEQLLAAYYARTAHTDLAHFLHETRSCNVWPHIMQATYNVCPHALLTRLHGNITPLHYCAAVSDDTCLLVRMYLNLRTQQACPRLYFPQTHTSNQRQLIPCCTNPVSLYEAASDTYNTRMQRGICLLYNIVQSGLLSQFPDEIVQHLCQF